MKIINEKVKKFREINDLQNKRKFSSYLLAMICYLRQCIICPILPIANVAMDITDFQNKSKLSAILIKEINKLGLESWLNNVDSVKSSRFKSALGIIDKHHAENLIVFTCFRTCLDMFKVYLPTNRKVYTLSSVMNTKTRAKVLEDFNTPSENGLGHILLLTYELGCEGLNLQVSNTVLLLDFYWNDAQTQQAIARVLRFGQMAETVNIYMFTSNTAIEAAMFKKHDLKLIILNELSKGASTTKLERMNVNDIIKIIQEEDNVKAINKIHKRIL
jgi:SNF2 family DNA or RNA helicase